MSAGGGDEPDGLEVSDKKARVLPTPKTFRERWAALAHLGPFLRLIWETNRPLTLAEIALRLVRALLPLALLYVGKLIIDEVVYVMAS